MSARRERAGWRCGYFNQRRLSLLLVLAALLLVCSGETLSAEDQSPDAARSEDQGNILEEFQVAKHGDVLLVPVRFADGHTFQFILDMGRPLGWVDTELQKYLEATGRPALVDGHGEMPLYRLVDAHVGRLPVGGNCLTGCFDLSYLREGLGYDIRGTLGMTFLRNYAIEIDFDRGRLAFLKRAASERGTVVPLSYSEECPVVEMQVGRELVRRFQFGMAMAMSDDCEMRKDDLDALAARGDLTVSPPVAWTTRVATRPQARAGCLNRLDFGAFAGPNAHVFEGTANRLPLSFLARYRVTFDFPESRLLLEKGPGFDEHRRRNLIPIRLRRRRAGTVVHAVAADRLAGADIKPGDRLLEIDGRSVDELTLYEVRGIVMHSRGNRRVKLEREGEVRNCELVLRERVNGSPAVLPAGAPSGTARAGAGLDGDNLLEEFQVAKHGGYLLVPVRFEDGTTAQFILDTGCTGACVDTELRRQLVETGGRADVNGTRCEPLYQMRAGHVGHLPLPRASQALCYDLSDLRAISGLNYRGVLGMEFMASHVIEIDFDSGRLRFLKRAEVPSGCAVVNLSYRDGCPMMDARVGSHLTTGFQLDSGLDGSCILRKEHFETLQRHGEFRMLGGESVGLGAFGRETGREGVLQSIAFGGFEHGDVVVRERRNDAIGMEILSRYRLTFDFPRARLYLEKGDRFGDPPPVNQTGLAITRTSAGTVVQTVAESSPAAAAGIGVGDHLLELYGHPIEKFTLHELRRMFRERGRTVRLTVEHNGTARECRLMLFDHRSGDESSSTRE